MESEIRDAVILMAGSGSRLRASGENLPKALIPICDRPLISYLIEALEKVGVKNLHIVVGARFHVTERCHQKDARPEPAR